MSDSSIAIICSSVVSIISVLIPIFTATKNNRHSRQMKELELKYENKIKVYKDFFTAFGKCRTTTNFQNLETLGAAVSSAVMFAPEAIRTKLLVILEYCTKSSTNAALKSSIADTAYMEVVPMIADDLATTYQAINKK